MTWDLISNTVPFPVWRPWVCPLPYVFLSVYWVFYTCTRIICYNWSVHSLSGLLQQTASNFQISSTNQFPKSKHDIFGGVYRNHPTSLLSVFCVGRLNITLITIANRDDGGEITLVLGFRGFSSSQHGGCCRARDCWRKSSQAPSRCRKQRAASGGPILSYHFSLSKALHYLPISFSIPGLT